MQTQVEELGGDRVRLRVAVPRAEVKHAVDHAASDLAGNLRIPGFRKGKVPMPVLLARVGRERLMSEAVESHIGGWFWDAAANSRIRPVEPPQYGYDLPTSSEEDFAFTATVAVQPRPEPADWTQLEVPAADADVPPELVERELEALRRSVAELAPVEDRPAREGDTLVVDLVHADGEAQRDLVVELGAGRLVDELERGLVGMRAGETKEISYSLPDGSSQSLVATVKEIKEPVLPPLDDDLARTASEFDSLADLRDEIERRLADVLAEEVEAEFRQAAVDALVEASRVEVSDALVEARTGDLLRALLRQLERRGLSVETYLAVTNQNAEQLQERTREESRRALARELVLEAVADRLGIEISDDELRAFLREQAELAEEDEPDEAVERIWSGGRREQLRGDLRLRAALDRVAAEVQRIPVELARAREKLWTPGQEKPEGAANIWIPSKERR